MNTLFPMLRRLVLLVALLPAAGVQADPASAQDIERAQSAIAELATALKSELQAAMQTGGPAEAVSVCHTQASAIGAALAERTGLDVGRVGTRVRNPANTPSPAEAKVLASFQHALEQGAALGDLQWSQAENGDFVYMKAIGVEPLCLQCHGDDLDVALDAQLLALYPDDQARGYAAGDLRGAFVVKGPVSSP